ncbi:methyltransferase domain-containing protein [Ferrovibrio sp.]|uniref:methyltransferase domain-containing protein n=1 Tax=Ferrovibrio sp. TaxID=1917215 RepID=UPI0025BDB39B|nr:methyltransferase domain-containing protein [Ferrovibrio sp.]MBX3455005.1 methyltransferase domain-containing protein [Ferrovibrio sp.]
MAWDPTQYLKFANERLQPALDLLGRIPAQAPETVVDFGCGAGNLSPMLRARWPHAKLLGVDSSPEMLAKARSDHPGVDFVQADVAEWQPDAPVDVLFSNATLQWLTNHEILLPGLLRHVKPGGWLAIQMPRNFDAPSHTCSVETVEQGPWRDKLLPHLRRRPVWPPADYWRLLQDRVSALSLWETDYIQVLSGENPVAEFTKGTWLKQFLDRLEGEERAAFEADYRARVAKAYPREQDGRTLFPFKRLFILAQI